MGFSYLFTALLLVTSCCFARTTQRPSKTLPSSTISPASQTPILLLERQNEQRFIGWVYSSGEWESSGCSGDQETLYSDGYRFACCTSDPCNPVVSCSAGSIISDRAGGIKAETSACSDVLGNKSFTVCNTDLLYENTLDSTPVTRVRCGNKAENWSFYRHKPQETHVESSATSSPELSTTIPPVVIVTVTALPPAQRSNDKSWIAAAVILPLALAGGVLYFLVSRKRKKASSSGPHIGTPEPAYPGTHEQKHDSYLAPAFDPATPHELLPSEATELESPHSPAPADIPRPSSDQQIQRDSLPPSLQIKFSPVAESPLPLGVDDAVQTLGHTSPCEPDCDITPDRQPDEPDTRYPELVTK
ncbi:uncharacterized protein EI97DRAFT_475046 [Westerdykella ornata]|uniref:Mid2 domain-containing protein n=1 Tax=Westerdykella ornata TaxID=318751 RepID=A0A6A6JGA2_WESOR|nr:uncharacterized protein EI97DRAFT_475046 [Westerdykella ornata]KAF2275670.1 hypothetical protein EI97DRAFT_475046 [Westerdykella ornata]